MAAYFEQEAGPEGAHMARLLASYHGEKRMLKELDDTIREEEARLAASYNIKAHAPTGMPKPQGALGDPVGAALVNEVIPSQERLERLTQRRKACLWRLDEVERYLDSLEKSVIQLKVIDRLTWKQVCDIEHYSISTGHRLLDAAKRKCTHCAW